MKSPVIYNSKKHSSRDIVALSSKGITFLCPVCKSKLLIITSEKMSVQYQKPQGIFCSNSDNHVWIKFILRQERQKFWDKFKENLKEIEE